MLRELAGKPADKSSSACKWDMMLSTLTIEASAVELLGDGDPLESLRCVRYLGLNRKTKKKEEEEEEKEEREGGGVNTTYVWRTALDRIAQVFL